MGMIVGNGHGDPALAFECKVAADRLAAALERPRPHFFAGTFARSASSLASVSSLNWSGA